MLHRFYENEIRSNRIVDTVRTSDPDVTALEVLTLDKVKEWLRLQGIDQDDALLTDLIDESITWLEEFCGICIQPQVITTEVLIHNRIELPYGPIRQIRSINGVDYDPAAFPDGCTLSPQTGFSYLHGYGRFTVVYTAGYTDVSQIEKGIIAALKAYIAYAYEHRGDNLTDINSEDDFAPLARAKASPYIRVRGF